MKIKQLKIYTSNLSKQIEFYKEIIGLPLAEQTANEAQFLVGASMLILKQRNKFTPYHFAINIPSNKIEEAHNWLLPRVEILRENQKEIHDFKSWNANAVYFYDADKNIVEFIARKNLRIESRESFGVNSLIEISEIGVPVTDIEATYNAIKKIEGIEKYDGDFDRFCAIGDENGLFICINKNIKNWFPTDDRASSSEFEMELKEGDKEYSVEFRNEKVRVTSERFS